MAVVRFLQVSDLHLGRPFGSLPAERRSDRRRDQRRALELAVRLAMERGVHAILLPGDLFDMEWVDADTLAFAVDAFKVSGCPPVFVAPGNHDPYSDASPTWSPSLMRARGCPWPEHVHVFTTVEWSARPLPGMESVRVWGRCAIAGVASAERPLAPESVAHVERAAGTRPPDGSGGTNVAVFHGSREGFLPLGQKSWAPFSDDEAWRSPFDYLAVGHIHTAQRLQGDGAVRLAYAGAAIGLDFGELGTHGCCEVRLTVGEGRPGAELEFIELDRRQVFDVAADATGCGSAEQVDRRIAKALDQVGASEQDIVTVRLAGRLGRGVRYAGPGPELRPRAFHLRVDTRGLRPDYDLDALRAGDGGSTEERFARSLLAQLDAEQDPARRAEIEGALYYGLDAFRLHEVAPAYEELGG